jgi:oxygen-independent coproporphyrinogen III oxidase
MAPALYIHIPLCRRKCTYCNFYSDIYDPDTASSYIDVLADEIARLEIRPPSIYVGGGTPTVLDNKLLERLLKSMQSLCGPDTEFTFEANPESIDPKKLKFLADYGVNRLSIGVQSLDERKLKNLGRIHSVEKALESPSIAERCGFRNINMDLMFGVWREKADSWKTELDRAVKLPVTHISCYELTYEKGTPLYNALQAKTLEPLEDSVTAIMYETAIDILSLRGFKQYEVSNFAKIGFECRHNLNYWDNNEYIGLGPSGVSYIDGVRSKRVSDTGEYIRRARENKSFIESSERLSPPARAKETAAVKIRTREGIDFRWFREKTGYDFRELEKKALPKLLEQGLVKYKKAGDTVTGVCLKRKGFLFCDTVSSALI